MLVGLGEFTNLYICVLVAFDEPVHLHLIACSKTDQLDLSVERFWLFTVIKVLNLNLARLSFLLSALFCQCHRLQN